jgi:hypothetical protein
MSSGKEREERAFEALIVSQLRKECDPEKVKPEDLPPLSSKEKSALASLGPDLIERLWNDGKKIVREAASSCSKSVESGEMVLNRAEEIDEKTAKELARRRAELLARMKNRNDKETNG